MGVRVWADQLMIYSKDDSDFVPIAQRFEKESATESNKAAMVGALGDFVSVLDRFCNLRQITICTHGNAGGAKVARAFLNSGNASIFLKPPHAGLFSGPGRLLFTGCNVGEGDCGRDFLIEAGRTLFMGKGGIVGGSTAKTLTIRGGLIDIYRLWGNLRVIKLDGTGAVVDEVLA